MEPGKFAFRCHASGGGPQGMKLRTLAALPCMIGVVRDSWNQGIRAVHPLRHWGVEKAAETSVAAPANLQ